MEANGYYYGPTAISLRTWQWRFTGYNMTAWARDRRTTAAMDGLLNV